MIRCSNIDCDEPPVFILEYGLIGIPARAAMRLCDSCWKELCRRMDIELRPPPDEPKC